MGGLPLPKYDPESEIGEPESKAELSRFEAIAPDVAMALLIVLMTLVIVLMGGPVCVAAGPVCVAAGPW
jgi:hypothetical protein